MQKSYWNLSKFFNHENPSWKMSPLQEVESRSAPNHDLNHPYTVYVDMTIRNNYLQMWIRPYSLRKLAQIPNLTKTDSQRFLATMSIQYKLSQLHWITLKLDLHAIVILRVFPKYFFFYANWFQLLWTKFQNTYFKRLCTYSLY